ncbi:uncharacterized protein [Leptinotarsa decemlineata]|uniref:uncharacterized protein n=1 Tax=Leptinotarsa decemlineata TaxID=7539 RepID=UPI003D30A154
MERKIDRNIGFAKDYGEKIEEYLTKGYIRKLDVTEAEKGGPRTWYVPHFGVTNHYKPGKLRLVFDAAAKSNGVSINDHLLQEPDLLQNLKSILWKFRQKTIAFCSDIRDMFHQVLIREENCSAQRSFWRGMDRSRQPDIHEMKVMTFGAIFSKFPEIARAIIDKHYVDDYLDSAETEEEAIQLILEVIKIHEKAGFEIRNWISNSQKVIDKIPVNLR